MVFLWNRFWVNCNVVVCVLNLIGFCIINVVMRDEFLKVLFVFLGVGCLNVYNGKENYELILVL